MGNSSLLKLLTYNHTLGESAKVFADVRLICIANPIDPYRKDRDACRAMLTDANFLESILFFPCVLYIISPFLYKKKLNLLIYTYACVHERAS